MGLALGIDTSNYKTSIALVDKEDNIVYDDRRFLNVKEGERGLRQQEALFQHVKRLPRMIDLMFSEGDFRSEIDVVAVSNRPRNIDGSYMPCFEAGLGYAKTIASSLNVPLLQFSHQEGHISAGRRFSPLRDKSDFISFHFSGGTTEALKCSFYESDSERTNIELIGGTKDISYGQLIDRIGVFMGYPFPAGEEIDNGAMRANSGKEIFSSRSFSNLNNDTLSSESKEFLTDNSSFDGLINDNELVLPKIKVTEPYINLSGIETAVLKILEKHKDRLMDENYRDYISMLLLNEISKSIIDIMKILTNNTGINDYLFVGGVSSSSYIRSFIERMSKPLNMNAYFASPDLASDNAVGTAFLGGDAVWL